MTQFLTNQKSFINRSLSVSFALLILAAVGQYLFTIQGSGQIRQEELAEAIRNVYWLEHGYIYDGTSSNIGWYATLLFYYHTFGFSLFGGRLLRVFLHAISIFCLHRFLIRRLKSPFAEVLTLTAAFSPTLVYFNSIQTSYAMDITYFPPLLLLGSIIFETEKRALRHLLFFLFGFITMIGAMSYPSLLFYGPGIVLLFFLQKPSRQIISLPNIISLSIGILLPLLLSLLYLKNPGVLIYDDATRSGLFRGGGKFVMDAQTWGNNIKTLSNDLFSNGNSYYFKARHTEFGSMIAKFAGATLLLLAVFSFTRCRDYNKWLMPPLLVLTTLFLLPAFADGMPGIRRFTGILSVFYWIIAIHFIIVSKLENNHLQKLSLIIGVILCVAHIFSCFQNARDLSYHNDYPNQVWFNLAGTPQESVEFIKEKFADDKSIKLCLKNEKGEPMQSRYSEIYPVIAGDFLWNEGKEIPVYACDINENRLRLLKPEDWVNYKWPH